MPNVIGYKINRCKIKYINRIGIYDNSGGLIFDKENNNFKIFINDTQSYTNTELYCSPKISDLIECAVIGSKIKRIPFFEEKFKKFLESLT